MVNDMTSEEYRQLINQYLSSVIPESAEEKEGLSQSMRYSLLAGGKRIRPMLALEFSRILGGSVEDTLPAACALEMIHTYSLIHDDLPCMDNDVLRRGKPTNHVIYGECTATLAGDALQSLAFSTLLSSSLPAERKVNCAKILADAAGYAGMCRGQFLDMIGEGKSLTAEQLTEINNYKTGALLAAACSIGAAAAGADDKMVELAGAYGYKLGLAFQIRDDMLDVISSDAELGKSVGSDADENKNTYVVLLSLAQCEREVARLSEEAVHILEEHFPDPGFLIALTRSLEKRKN